MYSIENHKLKFDEAVQAEQLKKGKNSRLTCCVQYEANVNRLKCLKYPGEIRLPTDSNLVRRFALLRV